MRELAQAVHDGPDRISDGEGHTYLLRPRRLRDGEASDVRWFVVDGAGRIYPLHERYRQKIEDRRLLADPDCPPLARSTRGGP
jgi:hypothetical protein